MPNMRAKFRVASVSLFEGGEIIRFDAVGPSGAYPADGADENNTFAKFTPNATLQLTVMNPALLGQYQVGQTHYADFSPAD